MATVDRTLAEVRRQNKEIGHHFFDDHTMRFFNSEILDQKLYCNRYFITRERPDDSFPWQYSVRCAHDDGRVTTVSSGHETATDARKAMRHGAVSNGYE